MTSDLQLYALVVTVAVVVVFGGLFGSLIMACRPGRKAFKVKSTLSMVRRHRWQPRHVGVAR
jgi:hypothetical protein